MKKNYFEVNLCNDELKEFRVICNYTPLLGIREKVTGRVISVKCPHETCITNYGLTCEKECKFVSEEDAKAYLSKFNDENTKEAYKNYLKKVEVASFARFDNAYNDFKRNQKEHSKRLIKSLIKEIK